MRPPARGDQGVFSIWAVIVAVACLSMVGLTYDGGTILRARARSYDLAGAAARASTQQLDDVALTEGQVALDEPAARQAAADYLAAHNTTGDVATDGLEVQVTVTEVVDLHILPGPSVTVTEAATARAAQGAP